MGGGVLPGGRAGCRRQDMKGRIHCIRHVKFSSFLRSVLEQPVVGVEGAVGVRGAGVQASRLALNVREELHDVLAEGALQGPAAQLLLLRTGVGLRGALRAVHHLVAGGEEEAGLRKGETRRRKVRKTKVGESQSHSMMLNLAAAK